ncbi:hypothetical protein, partial [Paenibacillus sp. GM2]|uniref:hypothetical protein n=1 Tax=Paenibacillus sp. GM2 TaxID=1622070 RepID=UPI000A91202E
MKPNYYGTPIRISRRTGPGYGIWIKRILIAVILIAAVLAGLLQIRSPRPGRGEAPPEYFSPAPGVGKGEMIARETHP